ncbi:MAG: cytochrome b5 domain-containing protein [Candidatus Berkelbacteria bacterium]
MKYLIKFDRFFAWVLFITMILFLVSGYGMTKGIISNKLAVDIHNSVMPPVLIIAFTIHAWYAIHMAFKRWQIWNWFTRILLALFFVAFVGYFGYLQYFYQQSYATSGSSTSTTSTSSSTATTQTPSTSNASGSASNTNQSKIFTLAELAKYNGKNGQPSYVAVDGKVYDLSSVFINGIHRGWSAGQDLSAEFHAQHADSILNNYTVVGTLTN